MKAALRISERDNVATALEPLAAGRRLVVEGLDVTARVDIPSGHKIALIDIPAGQPVIKYGSPIGLDAAARLSEPRLAEPSDDKADVPSGRVPRPV